MLIARMCYFVSQLLARLGGGGLHFTCIVTKKCIIGVAYNIILEVTSSIDYKKGSQFQEKLDPNDLLSYYTVFGSMYHMGNSVTCSILRVCQVKSMINDFTLVSPYGMWCSSALANMLPEYVQ